MTRRTATTIATLPNVPHVVGVDPSLDDVFDLVRVHRSITGHEPERVWLGPMRIEAVERMLHEGIDAPPSPCRCAIGQTCPWLAALRRSGKSITTAVAYFRAHGMPEIADAIGREDTDCGRARDGRAVARAADGDQPMTYRGRVRAHLERRLYAWCDEHPDLAPGDLESMLAEAQRALADVWPEPVIDVTPRDTDARTVDVLVTGGPWREPPLPPDVLRAAHPGGLNSGDDDQ